MPTQIFLKMHMWWKRFYGTSNKISTIKTLTYKHPHKNNLAKYMFSNTISMRRQMSTNISCHSTTSSPLKFSKTISHSTTIKPLNCKRLYHDSWIYIGKYLHSKKLVVWSREFQHSTLHLHNWKKYIWRENNIF